MTNPEARYDCLLLFYILFTLGTEINWALHFVRCLEDEKRKQKEKRGGWKPFQKEDKGLKQRAREKSKEG